MMIRPSHDLHVDEKAITTVARLSVRACRNEIVTQQRMQSQNNHNGRLKDGRQSVNSCWLVHQDTTTTQTPRQTLGPESHPNEQIH